MSSIILPLWMPKEPIDVFFFDWDSTLVQIEGIDFLASINCVAVEVQAITKRCMESTGLTRADYAQRLDLIKPHKEQINQLTEAYRFNLAPGTRETINLLQRMNKQIYILSAGIKAAIVPIAHELGIPATDVLAVEVFFDEAGQYTGFDEKSNLIEAYGKNREIEKNLKPHQSSLLLGDGVTDWEAASAVSRFVGFAGLNSKSWVKNNSDFYINDHSIIPLLPLCLTASEQKKLDRENKKHFQQAMDAYASNLVLIKEH